MLRLLSAASSWGIWAYMCDVYRLRPPTRWGDASRREHGPGRGCGVKCAPAKWDGTCIPPCFSAPTALVFGTATAIQHTRLDQLNGSCYCVFILAHVYVMRHVSIILGPVLHIADKAKHEQRYHKAIACQHQALTARMHSFSCVVISLRTYLYPYEAI